MKEVFRGDTDTKDAKAFDDLLNDLEKGVTKSLSVEDANTLFSLQRKVTAQLARARMRPGNESRLRFLDSLVKRGHNVLFPAKINLILAFKALFTGGFARIFRDSLKLQLVSWTMLLLGFIVGFFLTRSDHEFAYMFVGPMYPRDYLRELIVSSAVRSEFLTSGRGAVTAEQTFFFTALFFNNFRAAMSAFCVGIFFGFPTIIILLVNGALLGSFTAIFNQQSLDSSFLAWVLPHAIPELAAICIAAAGGLQLGIAVLRPDEYTRKDAVAKKGRDAVVCLALSAVLLVYAALIESFVRQSSADDTLRFLLVMLNIFGLAAYFTFAGRAKLQRGQVV
ncbi:MAG: stage II sporulation protein M [Myxococcota bacterium]|nr:stage II sporulation protein M [Myxococcota bacterium]